MRSGENLHNSFSCVTTSSSSCSMPLLERRRNGICVTGGTNTRHEVSCLVIKNVINYVPQKCQKISNLSLSDVFFQASKCNKTRFWPGFRPETPLWELTTLPRPPSGLGRETPHTLPHRRLRILSPLQTKFLSTIMR